jgi:2-keto-4-pentenoate hydratase/2-oxohepta-3-ene-1,7-dioic acid hydratase in catechol pathway
VNDVTVRELQNKDGQWTRAKGFDTFCPIGPRIVAGLDPSNLRLTTRVNGEVKQDSSTSDLIFDVPALIAFVSLHMTLEIGDVISTGTPAGVGNLSVGDRVEVEIAGIGVLSNTVIARL